VTRTLRLLVVGLLCAGLLATPVASDAAKLNPRQQHGKQRQRGGARCRSVLKQVEAANGRVVRAQAKVTKAKAKLAKRKTALKNAAGKKAKAKAKKRVKKAKKSLKKAKKSLKKAKADLAAANRQAVLRHCGG
jgi:hypothetical protein